jgi:capsular polysaccharide biosynthesis protein
VSLPLAIAMVNSSSIRLTEVREGDVLPFRGSFAELTAAIGRCGRLQLMEGHALPASEWCRGTISTAGGAVLPAWWSPDPIINCAPLFLYRVPDAFYMPRFGLVISSEGDLYRSSVAQARYRSPDLTLLPGISREGEDIYLTVGHDVPVLERAIVSMPWGALHNYGHFVLDCLAGLAGALELTDLSRYLPVFPRLQPWHIRHLQLLGISHAYQLEQELYRIKDVLFLSSMATSLHHPNVNYRLLPKRQISRLRGSGVSFPKIYVARPSGLKRDFRSDREIRTALEQVGFVTIFPEAHPIDEQIAIFRNARVVVGCAGAALANAIYCEDAAKIVEIIPLRMAEGEAVSGIWMYSLCALVGLFWRPYFCDRWWPQPGEDGAAEGRPELNFAFDLDVDEFLAYLQGVEDEEVSGRSGLGTTSMG